MAGSGPPAWRARSPMSAVATSGRAVLVSGCTVIVALAGLSVVAGVLTLVALLAYGVWVMRANIAPVSSVSTALVLLVP